MRETVVGAVVWTEESGGHVHASLVGERGKAAFCAAPAGSPEAAMLADARRHGDQLVVVIDRRPIDIANPHDPRPSLTTASVRLTWRTPRLGETGPFGPVDADNVVRFEPAIAAPADQRRRALAA